VSELRICAQDLITLAFQVLGRGWRGQLYLRKPELSVCSGLLVAGGGRMMLSDVNGMKTIVTSGTDDVPRRACGDCFVVFCSLRIEACRHAPELPGLWVWNSARGVRWRLFSGTVAWKNIHAIGACSINAGEDEDSVRRCGRLEEVASHGWWMGSYW
jgi:hypothetical protein